MPAQAAALNTDTADIRTSSEYADRGDGTSTWLQYVRVADGGNAGQGAKADAAVVDPTASASVIALLKGILSATKAEDAAHVSGDRGQMALGVRNDGRATLTSTDGDYGALSQGTAGNLMVTQVPSSLSGWSPTTYAAHAAASGAIKASAGKLYKVVVTNDNAALRYFMIHNAITPPADGVAPLFAVRLAAGESKVIDFGEMGMYFATGISWSLSTTFATKTIAAADASVGCTYY